MKPGDNPEENSTLLVSSHFMMVMSYTILTLALVAPGGSDSKESACNAGDPGSISGSRRSPGEGNGNPL